MKEKGIKAEDVKNLPPVEEIYDLNSSPIEETHGLDNPTQVVKVNSIYRFGEGDIPHYKSARQCLEEFDNFIFKQENFNTYLGRQLKYNSDMLEHLGIICLELKVNLNSLLNMLLWLPLKYNKYLKLKMICSMN